MHDRIALSLKLGYAGDKKHEDLANQLAILAAAMRDHKLRTEGVRTPLTLTAALFGASSSSSKNSSSDEPTASQNSAKKRKIDVDQRVDSSQNNEYKLLKK